MKAIDFNLPRDLKYDFASGMNTFIHSRLLLFDANAIGLLRHELIQELGVARARRFFLRFGYQHGYSDFMQMRVNYEFDSEMDLLASGPVIHTWEGLVQATPMEIRFDRSTGEFFFTGIWSNSYEAQQHLAYYRSTREPVCWSLCGYASGWCSAFFGKKLLAMEPVCVGKGDVHCEWKIQPFDQWGPEAAAFIEALQDL